MANVTRFDPFNDLARFAPFRELDDFFGAPRLRSLVREVPAEPEIRIDVSEDEKAYDVNGVQQLTL